MKTVITLNGTHKFDLKCSGCPFSYYFEMTDYGELTGECHSFCGLLGYKPEHIFNDSGETLHERLPNCPIISMGGSEMTEFEKLVKMMDEAAIPYVRDDDTCFDDSFLIDYKVKRIKYPKKGVDEVCSIIYGRGTYGYPEGLLEIRGLLTDEEAKYDDVVGHLTAEDVFSRIKADYETKVAYATCAKDIQFVFSGKREREENHV